MSAQSNRSHTAQIVDMVSLLDTSSRRRSVSSLEPRQTATLLSMRQRLRFQASIGAEDIDLLKSRYSVTTVDSLMRQVRQLLNAEFGHLRVYRYRQVFSVGHHCLEELIGGLLRVQFNARQIELPMHDGKLTQSSPNGLTLGWGVGDSVIEADNERLRRRRR